ncbi:MAG: penicillin-binding protein 1A [Candidatus Ozemobacteraceae bacterium]
MSFFDDDEDEKPQDSPSSPRNGNGNRFGAAGANGMIPVKSNAGADEDDDDDDDDDEGPLTITQRIIGWLWFFFKVGFALSIILVVVLAGALVGVVKGFSEQIPIITDRTYRPNLTSKVFDCKGKVIAEFHAEENRTRILPAGEIPKHMRQAVVAIEDERFYQHYGIDLEGIARAAIKNIQAGRVVQGASTLTQQLVKNAFLNAEKTLKRKAIEAMLAFQLERKYSKEEILTLYLNEIYFGHGAYGLDAAARIYFNKDAKDLTLIQCATLAGIPKSPVAYSPFKYPKNNKGRRELVLAKMVELGFISPAEYEDAKKQNPELIKERTEAMIAPYFVTYVRDILLEKYGANLVYNGGLKIHTTIDMDMQKAAEDAMANADILKNRPPDKYPGMAGSLICIEQKTGHIKAMWGGRDFEKSQFNRVTQAYRQPGSSFKPFVYGTALENGALPGDLILDEPISFTNPWSHKTWSPKNYDLKFHGRITLIKAIQNSFNIPAVKLIERYTPARVIRFARKLGITSAMEPNLSLALGSGNFTPLELCSGFGVFANQGILVPPTGITRIDDRDGNILEETIPQAREVMKAQYAAMLVDMMRNAVEKGTGKKAMLKGRAVAGKTGTTNGYVDAWFNGFTPELVCAVQFGYDRPKSLGDKMAGGTVAAPVWHAFMEKAIVGYPAGTDFPVPEGCARIKICISSGKPASRACPAELTTNQVYPIESIPKVECPTHSGGGKYVLEEEEGVEYSSDQEALLANSAAADDDSDFFRTDFSQNGEKTDPAAKPTNPAKGGKPSSDGNADDDTDTTADTDTDTPLNPESPAVDADDDAYAYADKPLPSARKPAPPQIQVEDGNIAAETPAAPPSTPSTPPNPAPSSSPREPGVVTQPNVEFRDNFQ